MSINQPGAVPFGDARDDAEDSELDPARIEVDGEEKLDPDLSDDLVDSAEADRLAGGGDA